MANEAPQNPAPPAWVECVKVIPQFLWVLFAAIALYFLYPHLTKLVEIGRIEKIGVLGVEVELHNVPTSRTADSIEAAKEPIIGDKDRVLLTERFHRLADKTVGATVLWVDDKDPYANVQERRVLSAANISVDMANSTDDALHWLKASKYDIVITNLHRPNDPTALCWTGSNDQNAGCDLLKRIKSKYAEFAPAVIIYTGQATAELPTDAKCVTTQPAQLFHCILDVIDEKRHPVQAVP